MAIKVRPGVWKYKVNDFELEDIIENYRECNHGIKVCKVDDILRWINDMSIEGTCLYARTDELKAQKKGEMMMLKKFRELLE